MVNRSGRGTLQPELLSLAPRHHILWRAGRGGRLIRGAAVAACGLAGLPIVKEPYSDRTQTSGGKQEIDP